MATVKFRIRSKANKNVSIKVYLSAGRGLLLETNTGFTIKPKEWSEKTGRPKQTTPENKNLYSDLNKLSDHIFKRVNEDLAKEKIIIDKHWLQVEIENCFNRAIKGDDNLLTNRIQYIINNANTRKVKGRKKLGISESRVKGYKTFKNKIIEYEKAIGKQIHFIDINKPFIDKLINWLINDKNYSTNYAGKIIDNLKTVCADADTSEEIQVNQYYHNIEGFKEENEDRYIITLSFNELEQIKNTEMPSDHLKNAKNWMLIGCEIGQRGEDLLKITFNENIRYNGGNIYLDLTQDKTKKSITAPIIAPHIIDIIEHELPHYITIQKLNMYIKDVCKLSGINEIVKGKKLNKETKRKELGMYPKHELIATHSFRRSYATNYYKNIPTAILINITGHSKERLFLEYINRVEDKDANADLFRKFYEEMQLNKTPQMKISKKVVNE